MSYLTEPRGESAALPALCVRRQTMGINKDQVEGRTKEAVGKVQEVAGKAVGSKSQQVKGMANKVAGQAQAAYGDVKENIKDTLNKDGQQKQG
jgi:uncharacterized protein YjbJ (UPF0337 family)